jgi:hypothetical protein
MLESFFGSLVDGRTLHTSYSREPQGAADDPLSLELAVRAYRLVERVTELGGRIASVLHLNHTASRPVGCG